eukprot:CAMPEP_0197897858 /NCGR_PEP_ID=MMETSP1439-20131203/42570_1 /TAXON_ID=66791 /ORGANISM="Gonyaulax spinifera, Strain CCMP409" /LENGTH=65 /DNA_ID=CAMNT_0043518515 /DNA_START=87 /DNA_END=282 /DNA_ORIENTATION=-
MNQGCSGLSFTAASSSRVASCTTAEAADAGKVLDQLAQAATKNGRSKLRSMAGPRPMVVDSPALE